MPTSPTLLFIPGAWHKPTCYDKVISILKQKHSLHCISITLPTTTGDPSATFKDDTDAAREAITKEVNQGRNVVVLAHSYGGMVGNSAIKGFTRPSRDAETDTTARPESEYVIGLILIASGFTLTGLTFMDPFFDNPPPFWRVNKESGFAELTASPRELFYHDLPEEEAEYWVSELTNQSLKALFEGGEHAYAGWLDVPVWYVGTAEDRGLPVLVQRMQVGMAREMGAVVEHRELKSSHSPFLSLPDATTGIIFEAVQAFGSTQESGGLSNNGSREDHMVAIPKSVFWKPSSWFRFGIPLAFGHVVGKGFRLYYWVRRLWRSEAA
ncbi:alpha/beta-hydrolase [Aspergillus karnatakaensis]|uniref:alpha/beta hydrolase n=1 Tax=Aspergillus karnatakaensis TaxID=1810916 RepID=UPI003CCDBDC7